MAANAIYFPHINVPADPWLLRMLLYWDRLNAIVPLDHHEDPGLLNGRMRDLVQAGLVQTLMPARYLGGLDGFAEPFLQFATRWSLIPRSSGHAMPMARIHAEKLWELTEPLERMGLLNRVDHRWYEMPEPLANRFMAYLATALGRLPQINAAPVTEDTFVGRSLRATTRDAKRDALLELLFPMPDESVSLELDDLLRFKDDHQALAVRFREKIERECILLADGACNEEKQERLHALAGNLKEEVDAITEAMKARWKKVFLGKVVPVLAPLAPLLDADPATQKATFAGALLSSAAALYQGKAALAADDEVRRRPLAYVAMAHRRFPAFRPAFARANSRRDR